MENYSNIANRRIRVFVSSTFRDMMEERNVLMTHTWPELRIFCRDRQVELVEVDLRWGIAEEQSTRKETLKLCLDEIRACRPYFIGLLGERYGWVPGDDAFTADLKEEQSWLKDLNGKSVTELEILHGVLNNPEMAGRAFFYFRDPKYVESISENKRADFLSEDPASSEKQRALKKHIRETCLLRDIPLVEPYPDPQSLAPIILEQLKSVIDKQFPKENIPDPLTREARDHEAFAEIRRRNYIGRPDYFEALDNHCKSGGKPLLLLGDSGSGKSALIANWIEHWRKEHQDDYIFQHYIGGSPDSSVHWKVMTHLMAEIKRWSDDSAELPRSNDDILRDFSVWLSKARIKAEHDGIRFIVILDALNQLEDKDHAHTLGWLPSEPFTGNLRLIVSTLPGNTYEALEKRKLPELKIEPLTQVERGRMIADYLKRFGKSLDKPRIERLSSAKAASNPLYLKILLDELRVTGTHEKLDERLDEYLKAEDIPTLLRNVIERYQRDYEHDRKGLVSETLGLIWSARRGLTETELLQLLRPDNLPQLPLVIWSPLRAVLEENLIDRGGILNFTHDFLRSAIEAAFLKDLDKKDDLKIQLANYFEAQTPTERSCDELPWLLRQAELYESLRKCLLNIDSFLLISDRDKDELLQYWVDLGEEKSMGQSYLNSFNEWKEANTDYRILSGSNRLGMFLNDAALYTEAEPLLRWTLEIHETVHGKDHPGIETLLNNLATLLIYTNRPSEAEQILRKAIKIGETRYGRNHPGIAIKLNNLAQVLQDTNRLSEAEPLMRRALEINEASFGGNNPRVATDLHNLAELLMITSRLAEAEPLIQRALKINEASYGKNHPCVATNLINLGYLFQETNRFAEAEILMQRALEIDEASFGLNHPSVARDLANLGYLKMQLNNLTEAEPLMRRALKIHETSLGMDHSYYATDLNNLARLLQATYRFEEAEVLLRRVIEIFIHFSRTTGHPHPHLQKAITNYSSLLKAMGYNTEGILLQIQKLHRSF
jgi:nephrocystin-3